MELAWFAFHLNQQLVFIRLRRLSVYKTKKVYYQCKIADLNQYIISFIWYSLPYRLPELVGQVNYHGYWSKYWTFYINSVKYLVFIIRLCVSLLRKLNWMTMRTVFRLNKYWDSGHLMGPGHEVYMIWVVRYIDLSQQNESSNYYFDKDIKPNLCSIILNETRLCLDWFWRHFFAVHGIIIRITITLNSSKANKFPVRRSLAAWFKISIFLKWWFSWSY